jgi:hypothetical protein
VNGENNSHMLRYYCTQGPVTDPGEYGKLFDELPDDIPSLCAIIQGFLLHYGWAGRYGVVFSEERFNKDAQLREVSKQLKRIFELTDAPLTRERPPDIRLLGCCRDFSTLLTAILRHKGVPARARCGFATYFLPDRYEDHWICQYWNDTEKRCVTVDAQLDALQRNALGIKFDTTDMPEGLFLPAGRGWEMCREGKADPETFGFGKWHGMWFIRGNLFRDLLSLNKIEPLAWDVWGLMAEYGPQEVPPEQMDLLDKIAEVTAGMSPDLMKVQAIYNANEKLHPPADWE